MNTSGPALAGPVIGLIGAVGIDAAGVRGLAAPGRGCGSIFDPRP